MEHIGILLKYVYIFLIGFVLPTFFKAPIYAYMAVHFINMMITCFSLHQIVDVPRKTRNYARCAFSMYMPIFLYSVLLLVFLIFSFEMYIVIAVALLLSLVLFIKYRKQALVPYLLLATSMSYERIKEESKQLYKQRKLENAMLVFLYFSALFTCFVLEYMMVYYEVLNFHLMGFIPLIFIDIYGPIALAASIHGNESKRGKFSLKALLAIVCMSICMPIVQYANDFTLPIKGKVLQKEEMYEVSMLKMDYASNSIRVSKATNNKEDLQFLKEVELPIVPVEYEIYYVDEILDRKDVDGTTLAKKDKAQSFITNGAEDDLLDIIFYHEYAHVLFHYSKNYKNLIKEYETLRESNVNNSNWKKYYVSKYAMTSTIEDMCETYAFYICDENYRKSFEENAVLKKKSELIRTYLKKEYGYDFYIK